MRNSLVALALVLLTVTGCALPFAPHKYESYHPVIPGISLYPGNKTRDAFYADQKKALEAIKARPVVVTPEMVELLKMTYDLDTLLQMREKQIEAYNGWARGQNVKNGYAGPELP